MGSATAVVEISSDDEDDWRAPDAGKSNSADGGWRTPGADKHPPDGDGWRTPGDVKDKSSDNGLDWAVKLLDGDCDAIGEDLDVSVEMQELWASLIEQTDIVVDAKKSFVDEPEKKRLRDVDDDDDDCVILDGDPEKAVAIAKEDEGPRRDATEDELQIVAEKGEVACRDFPHSRHLCVSLPFSTSSHANHCSMCHCYVCDSPAPCAFWGKGTGMNDHCHATDKDARWKILRQSKRKTQQTPKLGGIQNLLQSSLTASVNVMISSTGRCPVSSTVRQIQQPSIMVSQNMGQSVSRPSAPSPVPRITIPSKRSKRAWVAPPVYTSSNVNYIQHPVPSYSPMQPTFPRGFQRAQVPVPQGNTFWSSPYLPPPSAPPPLNALNGSQGYQRQQLPYPYPPVPPNTVIGTGVLLSRCTSFSTRGKQQPQGPSTDAASRTLKDALANLAHELGVPDYNIDDPPVGQ